jgi:hypothetical protein
MDIVEQLFRTSFAILTAILVWQITNGSDTWFDAVLGNHTLRTGVVLALTIVEIVVIWPMFRTNQQR